MKLQRESRSREQAWQALVQAEADYVAARMALLRVTPSQADIVPLLRGALCKPPERGTALQLLLMLDESVRRELFPELVALAAEEHADLQLVREVIRSLDTGWLNEHIGGQVDRILSESPNYEQYRRLAELLKELHSPHLAAIVQKAAASDDVDTREVADDFRT